MSLPPSSGEPAIARGRILAYRVFDVAATIALDAVEKRVSGARRVEMGGPLIEGLVITVRPVEMDLGKVELSVSVASKPLEARAIAHVFDFGVVSVLYEIEIAPATTLDALTPLCDGLYDAPELHAHARALMMSVVAKLEGTVEHAHDWQELETYTIVFVEELENATPQDLLRSDVVAKLLLGETSTKLLAPGVRDDVLRNAFSYLADDLVIVDWNSALVVEPSGSRVVPFVLELATCQLLEFRYYDGLLEEELADVYDHVEKEKTKVIRSPYGALTRKVLKRFMELTEFTERVDNALKSVGDVYLARVYLAAIRRFRVPEWRESVESKLALVGRAYEMLKTEAQVSRGHLLELTVVILILVEVLAAFQRH